MPNPSRQRRRLHRHFRSNHLAYQILAILGGLTAVLAFIFAGLNILRTDTPPAPQSTAAGSAAAEPAPPPFDRDRRLHLGGRDPLLNEVVDQIFTAYGGRERVRRLTSLRQEGQLEQAGSDALPVTFFWRVPDLVRYTVALGDVDLRRAFNGTAAWEARIRQEEVLLSHDLIEAERTRFVRDSHMSQPVVFALQRVDQLALQPPAEVDGRRCHVLSLARGTYEERLYFDQFNLLCLQRERVDLDATNGPRHVSVRYHDFREIDGVVFPFRQEVSFDHVPHNRVIIHQLNVDPGLLTAFFDPPPNHPIER